jgi:sulfate adenylyltransferase subunit 2
VDKIQHTKQVLSTIGQKTNRAILFYSAGKDSIVSLDLMYEHFDEIICVFMYFVKDLDHINKYLKWAKIKYPKITVVQVPHWNLSYILRGGVYCVENTKVKPFKVAKVDEAMRLKYGTDQTFYGMKKADSMNRRLMLNTYIDCQSNTNKVYPLTEWSNKEVIAYMKAKKLPTPVRYSSNASGGVGFNIDCYLWLRNNNKKDLEKMLRVFPMSEKVLFDYDMFKESEEKKAKEKLTDKEVLRLYKRKK